MIHTSHSTIYHISIKIGLLLVVTMSLGALGWLFWTESRLIEYAHTSNIRFARQYSTLNTQLASAEGRIRTLESEDQRVRNDKLASEVANIKTEYKKVVQTYEDIVKIRESNIKTTTLDVLFAESLTFLADLNYSSASGVLTRLQAEIVKLNQPSQAAVPVSAPVDANPPASGFKQQAVEANGSRYLVDIIAGDLNSTKVVVATASEGDCADNCPVDSLGSYVAKAGGYAGINGPYFCPESYPSCAGKKNSFDTLLMNMNKTYFNSANNLYSSVPAAIFSAGSARFVGASSEWGRDTGVDSVIAAQPMLLSGGEIRFGGDDEVKRASRGNRSFIASKGSIAYIGVVHNANVAEVALVLKAMGMENALNLDSGGSTALFANGRYIAGQGRNTPFGIVFASR